MALLYVKIVVVFNSFVAFWSWIFINVKYCVMLIVSWICINFNWYVFYFLEINLNIVLFLILKKFFLFLVNDIYQYREINKSILWLEIKWDV
jgi:hypothetical protein